MNIFPSFAPLILLAALTLPLAGAPEPPAIPLKDIPEALKEWESWATWRDIHRNCPTHYNDPKSHSCFWPSTLTLQVDASSGTFDLGVTVFHETWIPLPGSKDLWPLEVTSNGERIPVLEHGGRPAVRLGPGDHRIAGVYRWQEIPQRIPVPNEIGIVALTLEGKAIDAPTWDAKGFLWLKRDGGSEVADKDFLAVKMYAVLEDGIPMWLRTEIELVVSGKSREEDIGFILPAGWQLAAVNSPLPVAVDDAGRMKAQVRAGKWTVRADAFRLANEPELQYAADTKPAAAEQLLAFRSKPDFRMVEVMGAPTIDVSQTTFPDQWRDLPVYRWETNTTLRIEERMRGMGLQKPAGLSINRELWLDEDGRGFTFRDQISGPMQQIWRLDAAEGQDLGSVRSGGEGQLITRNPQNGAHGIEIRNRQVNLEATGRMGSAREPSATGWRTDADGLNVTLNLPPGWRLFALFGADWTEGDWLTSWTLLDLFLLLIFSLAVFRLWGFKPAILAFLAFGLSYHEPGAPRYAWLVLLMPLALLRVVPTGLAHRFLVAWKWVAVAALILILVPFLAGQVQQALYPQLEKVGPHYSPRYSPAASDDLNAEMQMDFTNLDADPFASDSYNKRQSGKEKIAQKSNLRYESKARIQTGPGVPEWDWRAVSFGWNGPVRASQQFRTILIPRPVEQALTVLRVILLLALAAVLLNARRLRGSLFRHRDQAKAAAALMILLCVLGSPSAFGQLPDQATLAELRERLLEPSDAYPNAADIPSVSLSLEDRRLTIEAEIHTAIRTAVPLPGRLPAWSPVSVRVNGEEDVTLRRDKGYLWVVLPPGVHRVQASGLLADTTEWEWTFLLKPRRVTISAPGWNVSGVRPDGVPEQQVFFALKQKASGGEASYDRQDFQTIAAVDRNLELGLVWQARTTVTRLSSPGKALSLRIPLLPGENVLSSNAVVKNGFLEARLGAQDESFSWESNLPLSEQLQLATRADDNWIERWHLVASPVWNVAITGLAPVFEPGDTDLIPVWHPWPGEGVDLAISRPEAIAGATVTVNTGTLEISLGKRQRVAQLDLSIRCSVGEDFLVDLPAEAEITALTLDGNAIPVRKDGTNLIVPLRPGEQSVSLAWKTNLVLATRATADEVRLPVESANINTVIQVPDDRWVLWTKGPQRGPAVRFWTVLLSSLIAAWILGGITHSPLRRLEWMLLALGLTQIALPAALLVVGWLFLLSWRGRERVQKLRPLSYNFIQLVLIGLTAIVLGIFIAIVAEGLLGNPEMFIGGNSSSRTYLSWYQARCETALPRPELFSISIWWYRLLMLAWALWLAAALTRWLRWAWQQFSSGGCFHKFTRKAPTAPPPLQNP